MSEPALYESALKRTIGRVLAAGLRTLEEITRSMEGAPPAEVLRLVRSLGGSPIQTSATAPESPLYRNDWPEPHPANYEWRFTEETATSIAKLVQHCGRIICLGCPTVFHYLQVYGVNATLFDRNPYIVQAMQALWPRADIRQTDLRFASPADLKGRFEVIVADPPWYPEHILSWVARATELATPQGARLLVTLFPNLTRPRAPREFAQIIHRLRQLGLVRILPLRPLYETPPFEAESFIASGISTLWLWRRGHWAVINLHPGSILTASPPTEPCWRFFRFGKEVVAVRDDIPAGPVHIEPLPPDGILRSTSSRDPQRTKIDLWTSRNRAFWATGGDRLLSLFAAAASSFKCNSARDMPIGNLLICEGAEGLTRLCQRS